MNLCIVINSYKRALTLVERSVKAALAQTVPARRVIFLDQNQPKLVFSDEIEKNPLFLHLEIHKSSVSSARNQLKIPSDCEWILFCDDDGYLDAKYIEKLGYLMESYADLEIFAGSIVRDDNLEFYSKRHEIGGSLRQFHHTKLLMGSNLVVKAATFDRLGRFDEQFGAGAFWGSGEETDFCWKAFFADVPMEFFKELVVYHIKPYAGDFKHSMNKAYQYGLGKGALVQKWLIRKHQPVVLFEFMEMLLIPLAQILWAILRLKFLEVPIYATVFYSRLLGFVKAFHRE